MMFFVFLFLFTGIVLCLSSVYIRRNPYSQINRSLTLSGKIFAPETVKLYADKISKAQLWFGIFYIVFAFIQYFIKNFEFSLSGLFIPAIILVAYSFSCRKILTGKRSAMLIILVSSLVIAPVVFTGISYLETSVTVDSEKINISGLYGEKILLNKLDKVYLTDTLPNIGVRTNGISTGTVNKGYFYSKSLQKNVKLLLHSNTKPYINIITADGKRIIINFKNREKIFRIYSQIKEHVENE
jgi:hypothetical protein